MIDRDKYEEAEKIQEIINRELASESLTPEQRRELELHSARLAGFLCSHWLPLDWTRRLIMAAIFIFGIQQAWVGNRQAMLLWLLLPLFSPRIVGEVFHFIGRLVGLFGFRG